MFHIRANVEHCIHLLPPTGEKAACKPCGKKTIPVRGCSLHGSCVADGPPAEGGGKWCMTCEDYRYIPPPAKVSEHADRPQLRVYRREDGTTGVRRL